MNLETGAPWKWDQWTIQGLSLSGIRTGLFLPQLGFAWDVAQGFPYLLTAKQYFISHGHMDHAAGIPYILSQKAMYGHKKAQFYMPESLVAPLTQIIRLWEEIEKHEYEFDFIPVQDRSVIAINPQYEMEAFRTVHRIESFGYTLIEKKRRLKKEFHGMTEDEIRQRRTKGTDPTEQVRTPLISFTGDTQIEFLDVSSQVRESKLLIMECTYMDSKKSVESARQWGHTHFDELIERLPDIKSEKIALIHLSSRYSIEEAKKILQARLPKHEVERIEIFPGR